MIARILCSTKSAARLSRRLATGLLALVAALGSSALAQPEYTVLELVPNARSTFPYGINNSGQVAGALDGRPFLWSQTDDWQYLSAEWGTARDVNDAGTAVGEVRGTGQALDRPRPFMWKSSTGFQFLAGESEFGAALAVNNHDQSVGYSEGRIGLEENRKPGMWSPTMLPLGSIPSAAFSPVDFGIATDVIDTKTASDAPHFPTVMHYEQRMVPGGERLASEMGYLWDGIGTPWKINPAEAGKTAIDPNSGNSKSVGVFAMNEAGQVVGNAHKLASGEFLRGFLYNPDGKYVDLGTLGGFATHPNDINEHGQVVGRSEGPGGVTDPVAFLWDASYGMRRLESLVDPSLGLAFADAQGINDRGQIIAYSHGILPKGYLLTPIPEPHEYALIAGIGLAGLVGYRRFRKS